jgi:hypothetical protein
LDRSGADEPPPTTIADIWRAVLAMIQGKGSLSWVANFRLVSFEAGTAKIAPLPRQESRTGFASTPRNRATLESMLSDVVKAPVRVEIVTTESRTPSDKPADSGVDGQPRQSGGSTSRLQRAMDLPTVRQLLDVFDVSIVEVHDDAPPNEGASEREAPTSDADGVDNPGE